MQSRIITLLIILSTLINISVAWSQCPPEIVDLTGHPDGTWMSTSLGRAYKCCSSNKAECIQFLVTLDPRTAGVQFEFYDGAPAYGSQDWQLNCDGNLHNVRDTICISGVGPHTITFCKPGNNEAIYFIKAVAKPTLPGNDTIRRGCSKQIMSYGIRNVTWNSISPGTLGQYDTLLSCTNCPSPFITATPENISYIDYLVCGDPEATMCGYVTRTCDTVRIYFADSLDASVNPNPASFCASGSGVTLNGSYAGGEAPYSFTWLSSSGTILSTTTNYTATQQGTYTFEVKDRFYSPTCPSRRVSVPVTVGLVPIVDAGLTHSICAENAEVSLSGSVEHATGGTWIGGNGTFFPNRNVESPTYLPTAAEIASGSILLYLTSTGAGGGCPDITDSVVINFSDTLKGTFTTPALNCYNSSGIIGINMSGGETPFIYKWSNGATGSSTTVTEGNYCVFVKDAFGCEKEFCTLIDAPPPINLQLTSIDVTTNGGTDGSAIVAATGGVSPYTYTWNTIPAQLNDTATNLAYGVYTVIVTDANGCSRSSSVVVNEPRCLNFTATFITKDNKCYGANKGSATVYPQGGTAPYTYLWPDAGNQTGPSVNNLTAGTYQAIITDMVGCKEVVSLNINQPEPLELAINHTDVTTVGGTDGSATAAVIGGVAPYLYDWSNGGTTSSITNLAAGIYSLTVYDFNKCSVTDSVKISTPACSRFNIYLTGTDINCYGNNNGTATAITINGTAPFNYLWSNGATTSTITNLAQGTYSVNVTDSNGCIEFKNITIYQPNLLTASISPTHVSCYGLLDGSLDLTVNGGTFPYAFSWSNGQAVEDLAYLNVGSYSINVTDINGCTVSSGAVITSPSQLQLTLSSVNNLCYGGFDGSISLTASGGQAPYTYSWSNGATTEDLSGLSAGAYVVIVRDGNSCQTNDGSPIIISEPDSIYITLQSATNVDCKGNATGSATVIAHGGSGSYSYLWNDGAAQTTATATNLSAGNYTVRVLDNNGCTIPKYLTVTISEPLNILSSSINSTPALCYGGSTGFAVIMASGGTAPYAYSWSNGSTNDTASSLSGGSYSCTITDINGCTTSNSITVSQPSAALSANFTKTDVLCYGNSTGSATVNVSGGTTPYTYSWSSGETVAGITNKAAGTYTVYITDNNGCQLSPSIIINQPAVPLTILNSTQTNVLCFGNSTGSASVTPTGGTVPYTYSWSTGATSNGVTGLTAGIYSVVITDANGCVISRNYTITQPAAALAVTIASTNVFCYGNSTGSLTATVTGGTSAYTYTWSNGGNTATITNLAAGTYNLTIRDANGCTTSGSKTITQPAASLSNTFTKTTILCYGNATGSITANPAGGTPSYTYSWSSGETTATISNKPAGIYSLTITDANGCTLNTSSTLTQPAAPLTLSGTSQTNVLCFGNSTGAASVTPAGGTAPYTYTWSNGSFTSSVSSLSAGSYSVTVKDNNNCPLIQNFTITQPPAALSLSMSQTNVLCNGNSTGSATVIPSGGTSPYTYTWTNGSFAATINNLIAGTYSVTVKDNNGCTSNTSVTITQPAVLGISTIMTPSSCGIPDNTGEIATTVTGGVGPYSYSWSGPSGFTSTTEDLTGLTSGTYSLVATDANLCTKTTSIVVTAPGALVLTATVSSFTGGNNISCYGISDGQINTTIAGGTLPYNYTWSGSNGFSASSEDLTGLAAGEYTLEVSDSNGCKEGLTRILTQPDTLHTSLLVSEYSGEYNVNCADSSSGSISLTVTGGQTSYSYSWTGPNGFTSSSQNITNLEAGNYVVTVTDTNGCVATNNSTLTAPAPLNVDSVVSAYSGGFNISCAGNSDGSISVTTAGGDAGSYNFEWLYNGNPTLFNTEDISGLTAGTYTLTVSDANGCKLTQAFILTQPDTLKVFSTVSLYPGGNNVSCYNSTDGSISVVTSGGDNSTYNFTWIKDGFAFAGTEDITGIGAGHYQFIVNDANECSAYFDQIMVQPDSLYLILTPSIFNGGYNLSCNNSQTGAIGTTVIGGTPAYQYSWTASNGFTSSLEDISSLAAGTYTLSVIDTNGCVAIANSALSQPDTFGITMTAGIYSGGFNVTCAGSTNGYINAIVTGGDSTSYNYTWTYNGQPTLYVGPNISGLAAGVYDLTVSDANNCTMSMSFGINEPDTLKSTLLSAEFNGGNQISCHGAGNAAITTTIQGGDSSTYSISWSLNGSFFAADSTSLHNLNAGIYTFYVTDQNECWSADTLVITEPDPISATNQLSDYNGYNVSCANSSDGDINITINGGVTPYTYSWSGGQTTEDISNLSAGTYSVNVTDTNGCSAQFNYVLNEPAALNLIATAGTYAGGNNISCNGLSDGSIATIVTGGVNPYSYTWTGPNSYTSNNASLTQIQAGSYTVNLSDKNNCSLSQSVILVEPQLLADSISAPVYNGNVNEKCFGDNNANININTMGGTTPYSYSWSGPNGYTYDGQFPNNVYAGTYYVTVSDQNGCNVKDTIEIVQPDSLSGYGIMSNYNGYGISCYGLNNGLVSLNITGGITPYSYSWTNAGGTSVSTNDSLINVPADTYYVVIADQNNCLKSIDFILTQPDSIHLSTGTSNFNGYNVSCYGSNNGSINTQISGGIANTFNYTWTSDAGYTSYNSSINNLFSDTYYFIATDINGCSVKDTVTLTEPTAISITDSVPTYIGGSNVSCNNFSDGEIYTQTTGGIGGYVYFWTFNGAVLAQNTANLSNLQAGTYVLISVDANECNETKQIILSQPDALVISDSVSNYNGFGIDCNGNNSGTISIEVSGGTAGYSYQWDNGSSSANQQQLAAGTYSLIVTDTNGCTLNKFITLTQPNSINTSSQITNYNGYNVSCNADTNGAINLTVSGGLTPYTTTWSNGDTGIALINLASGQYIYEITDKNNCIVSDTITLSEPDPIELGLSTSQFNGYGVKCNGDNNGVIDLSVQGGNAPYTYSWSNGSSSQDLTNVGLGTYNATVTDLNGCAEQISGTITQPQALGGTFTTSDFNGYNLKCNGDASGTITVAVTGGIPAYIYSWSNGSQNQNLSDLQAGSYSLLITDANGCKLFKSITLTQPDSIQITLFKSVYNGGVNISCFGLADGLVTSTVTGGTGVYTYSWTGSNGVNANTSGISSLLTGSYQLSVTDNNGCNDVESVTLVQPTDIFVSATAKDATCIGNTGSIDLSVEGGITPYSYTWSNGANTQDLTNIASATYQAVISDANNCQKSLPVTVNSTSDLSLQGVVTDIACYGKNTGEVTVVPTGTAPYVINWDNGATTAIISGLTSGTYNVSVTDANGCNSTATYVVNQNQQMELTSILSIYEDGKNISSYGGTDGSIEVVPSGGVTPYNYHWSNGSGSNIVSNLSAGTYVVVITDAAGCTITEQYLLKQPFVLEMPSGYTPNNDGYNDAFVVHGIEAYPNNKITVFNRWGNIVYEKDSYLNEWNGNNNKGDSLPDGTYFVILEINNGDIILKGYVDLRRQ